MKSALASDRLSEDSRARAADDRNGLVQIRGDSRTKTRLDPSATGIETSDVTMADGCFPYSLPLAEAKGKTSPFPETPIITPKGNGEAPREGGNE